MQTKSSPYLVLVMFFLLGYFLLSAPLPPGPDGKPRENLFQRTVVAVKVWLFDHRHLFKEDGEQRRYTTDEWHSAYANRKPERPIGPDGFPVIKHGEGF